MRIIKVSLRAEIAGYKAAMADARAEADKTSAAFDKNGNRIETASGRMVRSAEVNRDSWERSGRTLVAFGAGAIASLGLAAKAAMDWESAWAGVIKTVDGSHDQLARIQDGLRGLALELPASQTELANTAALLGQLGIQADAIVPLTKVMTDLGEATNLTAEQAATTLARFANIMGSSTDDLVRSASVIVDLGNKSATTEAEITDLGLRLAAAGKQAGLSEAQVLAFAAALSSVGVEAEAGGTAMSKVFTAIADAARTGNSDLATFARVAGVSASEFRRAFEQDASTAVTMFVEGLGRMANAGMSTTAIFQELGLTDQRLMRAVLSLGSAQGLLTKEIEIGNAAFKDNTALVEEANKRYDTTAAKVDIARNALNEAAITIGEDLLPVLATGAEGVANLVAAFANMPAPLRVATTGMIGLSGVASLMAGTFLLTFPRLVETTKALSDMGIVSPRAVAGLGKITKAAGFTAAALATLSASAVVADALFTWAENVDIPDIGAADAVQSLLDLADGARVADTALGKLFHDDRWIAGQQAFTATIDSVEEAWRILKEPSVGQSIDNVLASIGSFGQTTSRSRKQAEEFFATVDGGLTSLVQSGATDKAAAALDSLGIPIEYQLELLPHYHDALGQIEVQQRLAADSTEELTARQQAQIEAQEAAAQALAEWQEMARGASAQFINLNDAYSASITANTEWAQSVANSTASADDSWQDYYDGQSVSAEDYIAQLQAQVDAQTRWEDNIVTLTERARDKMAGNMEAAANAMIDELIQLGPAGAEQVALLASMTDEQFETVVTLWGQKGEESVTEFTNKVEAARQPVVTPYIDFGPASVDYDAWVAARRKITITASMVAPGYGNVAAHVDTIRRAGGGEVWGPGTSTSDSILAQLSNGEFVQRTAAHRFWGSDVMHAMNDLNVPAFWSAIARHGFAGGGSVGSTYTGSVFNSRDSYGDVHIHFHADDIRQLQSMVDVYEMARVNSRKGKEVMF